MYSINYMNKRFNYLLFNQPKVIVQMILEFVGDNTLYGVPVKLTCPKLKKYRDEYIVSKLKGLLNIAKRNKYMVDIIKRTSMSKIIAQIHIMPDSWNSGYKVQMLYNRFDFPITEFYVGESVDKATLVYFGKFHIKEEIPIYKIYKYINKKPGYE